jgi:hypothetical protein
VLAGAVVVAGAPGGAASAAPARFAAEKLATLRLRLGDRIYVRGSTIACVVQSSRGRINFACVLGSLAAPEARSYAVGIADRGADLAAISAEGGSAKLVTVVGEPTVSGIPFPSPARRPHSYTVAPTTAVLVGGTHIFCAVQSTQGTINVTCGLSSFAARLQFPAGTYTVSESGRFALLGKVGPKSAFKTVAVKAQP